VFVRDDMAVDVVGWFRRALSLAKKASSLESGIVRERDDVMIYERIL
jgi:hypothetical protein